MKDRQKEVKPVPEVFQRLLSNVFALIEDGDGRWLPLFRHDDGALRIGEFAEPLAKDLIEDLARIATGRPPIHLEGYHEPHMIDLAQAGLRAVRRLLGLPEDDAMPALLSN